MMMAKITLQFHAKRDEIAQLVVTWINELGLWLAFETFAPGYSAELVATGGLDRSLEMPPSVSRVVLSAYPMVMDSVAPFGLLRNNPASLAILLGSETSDQLGESVLQAMTDDSKSLDHWRRIRKALMANMRRGGKVVNAATGAAEHVKDHYYSPGAEELFDIGVKMSGPTALLSYEFGHDSKE
jgi:hypothetical protein